MDENLSEKEQIEQLRNWWQENGRFVMAGLILGVAALVGWNQWKQYRLSRLDAGAENYAAMMSALQGLDEDTAVEIGVVLRDEYSDTPYADQSSLALAKYPLSKAEPARAEELLNQVATQSQDQELRHVARLRLARVEIDEGKLEEALQTLDIEDTGSYEALYHETRGDVLFAMGSYEDARQQYMLALASRFPATVDTRLLSLKLASVPVSGATDVAGGQTGTPDTTEATDDAGTDTGSDETS